MTTPEPKRFTSKKPEFTFYIDDDSFTAVGAVPADTVRQLATSIDGLQSGELDAVFEAVKEVMATILLPDSMAHFLARMSDQSNPLTVPAMTEVSIWLVGEVYGATPTPLPSLSTEKPEDDGASSTDGAPDEESIPTDSPGTDTST